MTPGGRPGVAGVGAMTFIETVFPPIPSEVVLPLAGFVAATGRMNIVLVIVASTLGAYLGTFSFYTIAGSGLWNGALIGLGAALGSQYELVDRYARYLDYAVYGVLGSC